MSSNDRQRRLLRLCAGLSAAGTLGANVPALGQQEGLEEVVVSARFREENLQQTPLAITAFTGENLEARSLTDVTMLDAFEVEQIENRALRPAVIDVVDVDRHTGLER